MPSLCRTAQRTEHELAANKMTSFTINTILEKTVNRCEDALIHSFALTYETLF